MITLTHPKASNATTARVLGTFKQTAPLYVLVALVLEADAAILVASLVI